MDNLTVITRSGLSPGVKWLKRNKEYLSLYAIERKIGIPRNTLDQVLRGKRNLPDKWEQPLEKFLKDLRDSIDFTLTKRHS